MLRLSKCQPPSSCGSLTPTTAPLSWSPRLPSSASACCRAAPPTSLITFVNTVLKFFLKYKPRLPRSLLLRTQAQAAAASLQPPKSRICLDHLTRLLTPGPPRSTKEHGAAGLVPALAPQWLLLLQPRSQPTLIALPPLPLLPPTPQHLPQLLPLLLPQTLLHVSLPPTALPVAHVESLTRL